MKTKYSLIFTVALGMLIPGACGKVDPEEPLNPEPQVVKLSIDSQFMKESMKYNVWLPPMYNPQKAYPILYLLHGVANDQDTWLTDIIKEDGTPYGGNAGGFAVECIQAGGTPMIIVTPDAQVSFYMGDYETYFHQELMPAVEGKYKFNGKRAVAGLSMGGYGTVYYGLKYPEKFTYAYAMSPATFLAEALGADFKAYVAAQADKSVFPGFTIETGSDDILIDPENPREWAEYLNAQGISTEFILREGGHTWAFWRVCLPKALKKIGASFQ